MSNQESARIKQVLYVDDGFKLIALHLRNGGVLFLVSPPDKCVQKYAKDIVAESDKVCVHGIDGDMITVPAKSISCVEIILNPNIIDLQLRYPIIFSNIKTNTILGKVTGLDVIPWNYNQPSSSQMDKEWAIRLVSGYTN
jgi:hypothetical protein